MSTLARKSRAFCRPSSQRAALIPFKSP